MNKLLVLCFFSALSFTCAASSGDSASGQGNSSIPSVLSESEQAAVIAELNETCEENWCYGEFDYEFLTITCNDMTCELFFRATRGDEEFNDSVKFRYDKPLVDDGYLESGNWERVNDAISDGWEPKHALK